MDEKDIKIEELEEKLRESTRIVDSLKAELCREKLINDKLLQLERYAVASHSVSCQTNISGSPLWKGEGPEDDTNNDADDDSEHDQSQPLTCAQ